MLCSFAAMKSGLSSASRVRNEKTEEMTCYDIDDVIMILSSDYDNSYFVTGNFTSSIYAEDCIFEDPTIKFSEELLQNQTKPSVTRFWKMDLPIMAVFGSKISVGSRHPHSISCPTWAHSLSLDQKIC
uniref:Uncharacterized protein n=1 Tax=Kalanchoe fedtschenkoi TaxID=63787 RepID=A0A7N0T4T6_KALFE